MTKISVPAPGAFDILPTPGWKEIVPIAVGSAAGFVFARWSDSGPLPLAASVAVGAYAGHHIGRWAQSAATEISTTYAADFAPSGPGDLACLSRNQGDNPGTWSAKKWIAEALHFTTELKTGKRFSISRLDLADFLAAGPGITEDASVNDRLRPVLAVVFRELQAFESRLQATADDAEGSCTVDWKAEATTFLDKVVQALPAQPRQDGRPTAR